MSSTVECGFDTSGWTSCGDASTGKPASEPTRDYAGARSNRPWSWFPDTEEAVPSEKFMLYCTLASALIVIVLFSVTIAVWQCYVVRPEIMLALPTRAGESDPRVLVAVAQATDSKRLPVATTPPVRRRGRVIGTSEGAASLTKQTSTYTPTAVQTTPEGKRRQA
ncbi:hypothetical protein HPB50_001839 [Hyalomma asiaticum]|uniref:Uncharacterized protein n=1 Tax=Hyalomma asiaticum TaxID=266040 RepID=A0ACB7SJ69_HYAAI|nr:hypothetical protein HPB50_001839 [Hyalomma asiaticum]